MKIGTKQRGLEESQVPTSSGTERKSTRLLLLSSAKGGSAKTTTARNLAVVAAHAGLKIATVDLDGQATLTNWWHRRPDEAPTIEHFQIPIEESENALSEAVELGTFDLIIVDTPPGVENHPAIMRTLIRQADFILMPTNQGGPDLDSVIEWSAVVKREGKPASFLLSRTKRTARSFAEAKLRLSKYGHLCPFDVRDLEDIQRTHYSGLGILEVRGSQGSDDYQGVWNYISHALGLEQVG